MLGLPATPEVAAIAGMLTPLRDAAVATLGFTLDKVVISYPVFPGLPRHDIDDALDFVGLRSWLSEKQAGAGLYPTLLTEAHAVYAAYGKGLCQNHKNLFDCWEEEENMPSEQLLVLGFTGKDLHGEVTRLQSPFDWRQQLSGKFLDLKAGLDSMRDFESPEVFWERVENSLVKFLQRVPRLPTGIMLVGENATMPEFRAAVANALRRGNPTRKAGDNLDPAFQSTDSTVSPLYASSRGAALYARWRQEEPMGCWEWDECMAERQKERSQGGEELPERRKSELK